MPGTTHQNTKNSQNAQKRHGSTPGRRFALGIDALGAAPDFVRDYEPWLRRAEIIAWRIEAKLREKGIEAEVTSCERGPLISQYWLAEDEHLKADRVAESLRDLAPEFGVKQLRVIPVGPDNPRMKIEFPNRGSELRKAYLSEGIGSKEFQQSAGPLTLALGKTVNGLPLVDDLTRMPHLLLCSASDRDKSSCLHALVLSILYRCDPDQAQLLFIDPARSAFSPYREIPHLLAPVVTDEGQAVNALLWLAREADRRSRLFSRLGELSIASFNARVDEALEAGEPVLDPQGGGSGERTALQPLPRLVCFVDEPDLLMQFAGGGKFRECVLRLGVKAGAVGIHLVFSVRKLGEDMAQLLNRSNFRARICYRVADRSESIRVLGESVAENLMEAYDMMLRLPGAHSLIRAEGFDVSAGEVGRVVGVLCSLGKPCFRQGVTDLDPDDEAHGGKRAPGREDPLYAEAVRIVREAGQASAALLQRRLSIERYRASALIDGMEEEGVVRREVGGARTVVPEAAARDDGPALPDLGWYPGQMEPGKTVFAQILRLMRSSGWGAISAWRACGPEACYAHGLKALRAMPQEQMKALLARHPMPREVNELNTFLLRQKLVALGFGVLPLTGVRLGEDGTPSPETAFLAFDTEGTGNLRSALLHLGNLFNQDCITFASAGGEAQILETRPFSCEPKRARRAATGAILGTVAGVPGEEGSGIEPFFARLMQRAFGWDELRAAATRFDRELAQPDAQPQERESYGRGVLQSQIWTAARYAQCAERFLKRAEDPEAHVGENAVRLLEELRFELQIDGAAVTAQGLADSLYIEQQTE